MELKESHITMLFWMNQDEPIRYEYYQSTIAADLVAWGLARTFVNKNRRKFIQITDAGKLLAPPRS
jgi:hypothetical protein